MAGTSITAANAVFLLSINGLVGVTRLQGFAADDVFSTDAVQSAEVVMGVDGKLSGGFVYSPIVQNITLQADSDSNEIFDQWWQRSQINAEVLQGNGSVVLSNLGKRWVMTNGFLTQFAPIPDAKRILQAKRYQITWERIYSAPA